MPALSYTSPISLLYRGKPVLTFSFIGRHRVPRSTWKKYCWIFYHFQKLRQFCSLTLFWPLVAKLRFHLQERFALGGTVKDATKTPKVRIGARIERKNSNNDLYCLMMHILRGWWHLIFYLDCPASAQWCHTQLSCLKSELDCRRRFLQDDHHQNDDHDKEKGSKIVFLGLWSK